MYEVGVVTEFTAKHQLFGDFGPAAELHSHQYRLEVIIRGPALTSDGILFDIAALKAELAALVAELGDRDLAEVPDLATINTTVENVAHYCWQRLAPTVRGRGPTSLLVRLWEDPGAYGAVELSL